LISVQLLHTGGPDREALEAYLVKRGHRVVHHERPQDLVAAASATPGACAVMQEAMLPADFDMTALGCSGVLILGADPGARAWPGVARHPEPYHLGSLAEAIERAANLALVGAAGSAPAAMTDQTRGPSPRQPDVGPLLRGISHALSNPLAAASGWAQLLGVELAEDDPRQRALRQVRVELSRMESLLRALSLIGGKTSATRIPLDVSSLLARHLATLESEGLPLVLEREESTPLVEGDPASLGLMLEMLLGSFLEDRGRVRRLVVSLEASAENLDLSIDESGGTLGDADDPHDLGLLLRTMRHSRALGIALAVRLVEGDMGGKVDLVPVEGVRVRLRLRMPVTSALEAPQREAAS